jgi:uncharacterized repeat protein (TIGR03847 family)
MQDSYDLGDVTLLTPVAVGQPGKRTFFLAVGQTGRWLRVWLEKEDLQGLAMAVRQFLFALHEKNPHIAKRAESTPMSEDVPIGLPSAELEVDELTLGHDDGGAKVDVVAHGFGPRRVDKVVVHLRATLGQLRRLGNQADGIYAAGRPRCPLCGEPIDPTGHVCPASN